MPDFFPLAKGAVREYSSENAQGKGAFKVEVLSVAAAGGKTVAKCRRTTAFPGQPPQVAPALLDRGARRRGRDARREVRGLHARGVSHRRGRRRVGRTVVCAGRGLVKDVENDEAEPSTCELIANSGKDRYR